MFSPYLHLLSLFSSEVILGAALMFLRAEVPNSPCCLMVFKYVFNKQLQAFCLNSFLCVDLLDISIFHHEGRKDHIHDENMHA